jgi:hypothetical protein
MGAAPLSALRMAFTMHFAIAPRAAPDAAARNGPPSLGTTA